jgi:hypothetical protein
VKRDEPPPPAPATVAPTVAATEPKQEEENYFYERRVIERDRAPRRRDDSYDDRRSEIRPRDSASQYSDDSYEYVRREKTYETSRSPSRSRSRSHSPHHRRHLAEGAVAGIGAAELLRHHRKSRGEDVGGRGKSALAGAAVGAVGAEAVSRIRSYSRRRKGSRSRSRSSSSDDRRSRRDRGRKHRSRSRSKSLSRKQLGGLAAAAAVAGLAGYALSQRGKNKETVIINDSDRRSRSRRRRASVDSYYTERTALSDGGGRALDPDHRNRRMAQVGLASAAAAGIAERIRSKSRGGRSRSKSRVRQAVPIVASGLGGAALAGLYEKNKANKEAKKEAIIQEELGRGRRARSRSRSRSVPAPYPADDRYVDDRRDMIAYGDEPIYPEPARGYYSDEEPGLYRRRHRGGSDSGSSPDTRRRSHSRSRHLAETAAVGGAAAYAGHEMGKRRERSRQRVEADRREHVSCQFESHKLTTLGYDDPPYQQAYDQDSVYSPQPQGYLPPEQHAYQNQSAYPGGTYFPPPPTGEYAREAAPAAAADAPYPAYNPADFAHGGTQPYPQTHGAYGDSEATLGAPYPNDTFAGDPRYQAPNPAAHDNRNRGGRTPGPDDVSAPTTTTTNQPSVVASDPQDAGTSSVPAHEYADSTKRADVGIADGMSTPRAPRSRSQSRVRFNLDANETHSPEARRSDERHTDTESSSDRKHRRNRKRREDGRSRDGGDGHRSHGLMHDKYEGEPESDSDGTIELPDRFDEHGNRKPERDPLAEGLNRILGDVGFGDILGRLAGGTHDDDEGGRSGRRRHRH